MDFDIWTADGDLIVLVYIYKNFYISLNKLVNMPYTYM